MKQFLSRLRHWWGHLGQVQFLWLITLGLMLPNIVLTLSPYLGMWAKVTNLLLPLGLYICLFSLGRRPGRTLLVWMPFLLLINAFQLVLFAVFSGEIIAVDMLLNLFSASGDEAGELLGGLILPIALSLLALILIIVLSVRSWRAMGMPLRSRCRFLKLGSVIILVGLIPLWLAHRESPAYALRGGVYPISVFYNMYVAGGKVRQVANYYETSAAFDYHATSERTDEETEVYVFVLGETSRAYSWQLYGYARETNPQLMSRRNELVVFKDVTTQSNTTYKSVPILLSPADGESSHRLPEVKGILTALRQAGYHTVYISNQPENRSFLDFFAHEANEHYRIRDLIRAGRSMMDRTPIYDTDMLPYLDRALDQVRSGDKRKLFIILHAYGAHWNYRDRYPASAKHFAPDDALGANALERPKLVNAYDNAIRYTDYLLAEVIRRLEALPATTAMYYTADHGEDVFDDARGRILHSSPSVSYYQLHVPSILWLSQAYRSAHPAIVAGAEGNADAPTTSRSNFHTLLQLSGVTTPERRDSLSLLSPDLDRTLTRSYLNDRYECVPLLEMLPHEFDAEVWKRMGLAPYK